MVKRTLADFNFKNRCFFDVMLGVVFGIVFFGLEDVW